jgi:ABC-type sugar transport system substrate-binding protein
VVRPGGAEGDPDRLARLGGPALAALGSGAGLLPAVVVVAALAGAEQQQRCGHHCDQPPRSSSGHCLSPLWVVPSAVAALQRGGAEDDHALGQLLELGRHVQDVEQVEDEPERDDAEEEAARFDDVDFVLLEGTNDSAAQVSQVEQLIAEDPHALIILPHEGDPLTPVALEAMEAGIPVVNLDREFASEGAYRTWIGGDNYGIGVSAANYFAEQLDCQGNVVEIQGLAGISVTEQRTAGFSDTIEQLCGDGIRIVARQPADFLPDQGLEVMETILEAESQIDGVYTHDDDMAEGVVSAIENAGREDEMFLTGAGGSRAAMERIQEGGLYAATFLYSPSMSASAVRVARLIMRDRMATAVFGGRTNTATPSGSPGSGKRARVIRAVALTLSAPGDEAPCALWLTKSGPANSSTTSSRPRSNPSS